MDDDFDRALMEALNEVVPPVAISPGLADRLVARARHRARFWRLLVAFLAVSAAFGAAWTASELANNAADDSRETADATPRLASDGSCPDDAEPAPAAASDSTSQPIPTPTKGEAQVTSTRLRSAAALAGAIALATAQPTAAGDDYQFIVSGYPAANPRQATRSAATGLETGAYRIASYSDALEARYRTCVASNASALRSDEFKCMMIIMR